MTEKQKAEILEAMCADIAMFFKDALFQNMMNDNACSDLSDCELNLQVSVSSTVTLEVDYRSKPIVLIFTSECNI